MPLAADFFALFESMYVLMTNSAVLETFNEEKRAAGIDQRIVPLKRRLSDTRWSCRYMSIKGVLITLKPILSI